MNLARRLMHTQPMQPYLGGESYPASSDDELQEAARHWGNTTFHVMGTCRKGPASDTSVD